MEKLDCIILPLDFFCCGFISVLLFYTMFSDFLEEAYHVFMHLFSLKQLGTQGLCSNCFRRPTLLCMNLILFVGLI